MEINIILMQFSPIIGFPFTKTEQRYYIQCLQKAEEQKEIMKYFLIEKELDFKIKTTVDLTSYENDHLFLEGNKYDT